MSTPEMVEIDAAKGPMMASPKSSGGMTRAMSCGMTLSTPPSAFASTPRTPRPRTPTRFTAMFIKAMTTVPMIIARCISRLLR